MAGLGAAFLGVGLLVGRKALGQFGRAYRLLTTDVVAATDVTAGGTTAVSGAVEARGETGGVGSLFEEDAVFCYTEAQKYVGGDTQRGQRWDTYHWNYEGVPFDVADGTGSVGVSPPTCPTGARTSGPEIEVDLPMESVTFESDEPAPDGVLDYIEHVDGFQRGPSGGTLRFRQSTLVPGEDAFVLGEATTGEAGPPTEVVIDGETRPGTFAVADEAGGSPLKNALFGLFLSWFAVAGTGAGGYFLYLLVT
ncbi:MAG: hypothetical protein ABEJ05_08835 [Haloglomus sp.]